MPIIQASLAVLSGAFLTTKLLEAARSRDANKFEKRAHLPPSIDLDADVDLDSATQDSTGAYVRALLRPDGVELYVREYKIPNGTLPIGVVVLVHGWMWHSEYFADFAKFLSAAGLSVFSYDLRGHGKSGLVDGIPGYTPHIDDYDEDLLAVLQFAQQLQPGQPSFLWSESTGALATLRVVTKYAESPVVQSLKGFIMAGAELGVPQSMLSSKFMASMMTFLSFGFPKLPMPVNASSLAVSQSIGNADRLAEIEGDGLLGLNWSNLRLRTLAQALRRSPVFYDEAKKISTPWLALSGSEDSKQAIEAVREFFAGSNPQDNKSFIVVPGAKHRLLQDTPGITRQVMAESLSWIQGHLCTSAG